MSFIDEINRRRTFAIIAHPDAGKTTLTEKLLLFGGAIQVAGAVKSNKINRHTTSDFMEIEKQRGISVSTSVMAFEYKNYKVNILDTPGHEDFAEDTYRTLTAVDSVILVIDCVKGVESQTRKLLEVCRMRNTPVIVFINNLVRYKFICENIVVFGSFAVIQFSCNYYISYFDLLFPIFYLLHSQFEAFYFMTRLI